MPRLLLDTASPWSEGEDSQLSLASISRGPRAKTLALMAEIEDFLAEFPGSVSTRQVYYQMVSRGSVPNSVAGYDRVQRLLVNMRRDGSIPYDRIVDRTRAMHQLAAWDGAKEVLGQAARQYRRNRWTDQDTIVMIACEKRALEGVCSEICDEYGASLCIVQGFSSESLLYEWSRAIKALQDAGKRVVVAYFGDHDPSGMCIETTIQQKLDEVFDVVVDDWRRCGLLWQDFATYNLVNVPVKLKDPRSRGYLQQYGDRAAELDALPPAELADRIRSVIEEHIDMAAWSRLAALEKAERESINLVVGNWDQALAAAAAGGVR